MRRAQLRQQRPRPADGPRDQLREKAEEQRKIPQVALRRGLSAPDIEQIAERLERVKADAQRQHERKGGLRNTDAERAQQGGQRFGRKGKVLEKEQRPQAGQRAQRQRRAPPGARAGAPQRQTARPGGEGVQPQEQDELRVPAHIKAVAERKQHGPAPARRHGKVCKQRQRQKHRIRQ